MTHKALAHDLAARTRAERDLLNPPPAKWLEQEGEPTRFDPIA